MGKINILDPSVFNMLAAGEVVERPASVVKELVENSIDAGATRIDVYIERGGIGRIQVSDNGIGILPEDMRTAFIPHATSKLKNIRDLDSIATLGFRGEALASIASVSEVTVVSKARGRLFASKIALSAGNVTVDAKDNRSEGTIITVDNLFFNTPARLKFLKKQSGEQRVIVDMMRELILANPEITLTLSSEDGALLSNEGGELKDAIIAAYDAKTFEQLRRIEENKGDAYSVSGYVSSPDFTKPNRTYQTVIINGRVVKDQLVQTAAEKAYANYLMKRNYPMFVLNLLIPFEDVDVNVHPSKTEVRFADRNRVFSAVYRAVRDVLDKASGAHKIYLATNDITGDNLVSENMSVGADETSGNNGAMAEAVKTDTILSADGASTNDEALADASEGDSAINAPAFTQTRIDTAVHYPFKNPPKIFELHNGEVVSVYDPSNVQRLNDSPISAYDAANADRPYMTINDNSDEENVRVFDGRIIGQIFATYLVVERDETLYIIDQHAAHERILYDKIVDRFDAAYAQPLLIPYKLSLTGEEEEYLERILPSLGKLGFEITRSAGSYLVRAVPEPVSKLSFAKFFGSLFENMFSESDVTLVEMLKDSLCQQACKAAIKGGKALSREQIERVIGNYLDKDGALPTKCPHGRPAAIAVTKRDIEKLFKRIV